MFLPDNRTHASPSEIRRETIHNESVESRPVCYSTVEDLKKRKFYANVDHHVRRSYTGQGPRDCYHSTADPHPNDSQRGGPSIVISTPTAAGRRQAAYQPRLCITCPLPRHAAQSPNACVRFYSRDDATSPKEKLTECLRLFAKVKSPGPRWCRRRRSRKNRPCAMHAWVAWRLWS